MPRLGDVAKGVGPLLEAAEEARPAAAEPRVVPCRGCAAPMFFVEGPNGRAMPVDAGPTTVAVQGSDGRWRIVKGHVPHHITCPKSDQFRRPRR